ncbi:MAG: hypothetical protein CME31_10800 [Gimesia sp.]|uniref:Uncharacterized protein n=1 Tax=Gimesia maris TaxID=122 RepID=A0A3D3RG81_9PLAN|nr:hypothetical protein [Gimesia sp.]HCO27082.1 hypothetical protein [Gimesia maris]|tara:strand:+ start:43567 stop:44289 length:723 start_codon:yes stop_codon:yes gene_type:complete
MALVTEIRLWHQKYTAAREDAALLAHLVDQSLTQCRRVLEILEVRLAELGYPVTSLILEPETDQELRIARVEAVTQREVPIVLKQLWRTLGGISFIDVDDYSHCEFWGRLGIEGAHGFCDGVYVDACSQEWLDYTLEDFEACQSDNTDSEFLYSFAPDGYHKDDISGGDPYGLRGEGWLAEVVFFSWSGKRVPESAPAFPLDLLGYLWTSILECGGFPGLLGHPKFEPIREKLVAGLPLF